MATTFGWRRLGIALAAGSVVLACQTIAQLERPKATAVSDAATDDEVATAPLACDDSTLQPPRTGSDDALPPFDVVLAYLGAAPAGTDAGADAAPRADAGIPLELCPNGGFNFDRRATCWDNGVSHTEECPHDGRPCPWGPSCKNVTAERGRVCDTRDGVDNAIGTLLGRDSLGLIKQIDPNKIDANAVLRSGQGNLLIRISGYNGFDDDPQVTANFISSTGLASTVQPLADSSAGVLPDANRWDGRSLRTWYLDPEAMTKTEGGVSVPKAPAVLGYVSNFVLVLDPKTLPIPLFLGHTLELEDARLVGELRHRSDGWEIVHGRIGGRAPAAVVMQTLASITYFQNDKPQRVCDDSTLMALVRYNVCGLADLATVADAGTDTSCGMLSLGTGFIAAPALEGPEVASPGLAPCTVDPSLLLCAQ